MIMKSRSDLEQRIRERIKAIHSYKVFEFVKVPIEGGSEEYLKWVAESVIPE